VRPFWAFVAGAVAVLVAIVTVPLFWVSTHVADEGGYVAFSRNLAADQELQAAFSAYLVDDYVQRGVLPESSREAATSALTAVTRDTTNQPGFTAAWAQTQRDLHRSAFSDEEGPLTVGLQPMATFVTDRLGDALPGSLEVSTDLRVPAGTARDRDRLEWVERSQTFALVGLMIVLAAAAMSLVVARSRPLALAGLGLGALATAGVLRVAVEIVTPRLIERAGGLSPFTKSFHELLFTRVSTSLTDWLGWIAVAGAAAVVAGGAGRLVVGRR
jgi:hypothetical protein